MATTVDSTTVWGSGDRATPLLTDIANDETTDFLWSQSTMIWIDTTQRVDVSTSNTTSIMTDLMTRDETGTTTTATATYEYSSPTATSTLGGDTQIIAGALLIIIAILALLGNVAVIVALRHKCYKSRALYTFLNNLAITVVCDCVFNVPFIVGAMLSPAGASWLDQTFLCAINSFVFNLVHTQVIMCLLVLVLDRVFSLRYAKSYIVSFVGVKANLFAGYTWIHSTAFNLAIIVTSVDSDYFEFRYLCSVLYESNLVYNILITLFCVIAPWIAILCSYVYIVRLACETNARDRGLVQAGYDELAQLRGIEKDLNYAKPVGVLVVMWCVLIGPYQLIHMTYLYSGRSSDSTVLWMVFTGLKFMFNFLVSLVIFFAWPETWKEIRNVFSSRPNNAIESGLREHVGIPGVRSSWADDSDGSVTDRSTLDRSTISRSFPIPVLFATSNGLQLQVGSRGRNDDGEMEVADLATENESEIYRRGIRPPPYLPPLFSVVHSSEEDSFNTNSTLPLKEGDYEAMELNQSVDRKSSAATQFQLSLGKGDDFKTLKSLASSPELPDSPRDVPGLHQMDNAGFEELPSRKADYVLDDHPPEVHKSDLLHVASKTCPAETHEQLTNKPPKPEVEISRTKRAGKHVIDTTSRPLAFAKEQNQSKSDRERGRKSNGPTRSGANNKVNGTAINGGGRVGGGGGGKSREEREKRQRNLSGKSVGSERPSPRPDGTTKKDGDLGKSV